MHQIGMHLSYQTTPLSEGVSQKITNTIALSNLKSIFSSSIRTSTSYDAFTGVDAIMTLMKMMCINGFLLLI